MVFTLTACAHVVRIPQAIERSGGFYLPWDTLLTSQSRDVLTCVGYPSDELMPRPSLWISNRPLIDERGLPLMAFYDMESHAVIFAPYVLVTEFVSVFRHEMIHARERVMGHGERFDRYEDCRFWPSERPPVGRE